MDYSCEHDTSIRKISSHLEGIQMNTLTKVTFGLSVAIAAGALGIGALSNARPTSTPAAIVADHFALIENQKPAGEGVDLTAALREAAAALAATVPPSDAPALKGDRLDVQNGAPADRHGRYITFQRQTGPSASEATRNPVADVANR